MASIFGYVAQGLGQGIENYQQMQQVIAERKRRELLDKQAEDERKRQATQDAIARVQMVAQYDPETATIMARQIPELSGEVQTITPYDPKTVNQKISKIPEATGVRFPKSNRAEIEAMELERAKLLAEEARLAPGRKTLADMTTNWGPRDYADAARLGVDLSGKDPYAAIAKINQISQNKTERKPVYGFGPPSPATNEYPIDRYEEATVPGWTPKGNSNKMTIDGWKAYYQIVDGLNNGEFPSINAANARLDELNKVFDGNFAPFQEGVGIAAQAKFRKSDAQTDKLKADTKKVIAETAALPERIKQGWAKLSNDTRLAKIREAQGNASLAVRRYSADTARLRAEQDWAADKGGMTDNAYQAARLKGMAIGETKDPMTGSIIVDKAKKDIGQEYVAALDERRFLGSTDEIQKLLETAKKSYGKQLKSGLVINGPTMANAVRGKLQDKGVSDPESVRRLTERYMNWWFWGKR